MSTDRPGLPESRRAALREAPRVGGRGNRQGRQAPLLRQAGVLHRRRLAGPAARGYVRRQGQSLARAGRQPVGRSRTWGPAQVFEYQLRPDRPPLHRRQLHRKARCWISPPARKGASATRCSTQRAAPPRRALIPASGANDPDPGVFHHETKARLRSPAGFGLLRPPWPWRRPCIGLLWTPPSYAFRFGSEEGLSGSFDSTLSYRFRHPAQSSRLRIIGNDSGGTNRAPTRAWSVLQPARAATATPTPTSTTPTSTTAPSTTTRAMSFSHVPSRAPMTWPEGTGWLECPGRVYWAKDFKMDQTRRTELDTRPSATHRGQPAGPVGGQGALISAIMPAKVKWATR
jgi:hypothetical protein